jgi:hypothetical protein
MGHEGRTLSRSVRRVHLTQREPVVDMLEGQPHATVHDSQATPKKCEDYCEREIDELELQGACVYLQLGA